MSNILVGIFLSLIYAYSRMMIYSVMTNFNTDRKVENTGSGRQMYIKWL